MMIAARGSCITRSRIVTVVRQQQKCHNRLGYSLSTSSSSSSSLANAQAREGLQRLQQSLHASRQYPSSSTANNNDVEASKKLQEGIQDGLLRSRYAQPESHTTGGGGGNGTAGSSSSANLQKKSILDDEKRRNFIVNTVCSFMVVLLAAQSLKSGVLKRRADTRREACEEVLQEAQERLKYITSTDAAAQIARECMQEIQQNYNTHVPPTSKRPSYASWWKQQTGREGSKDSTSLQPSSQIQEDNRHDSSSLLEERLTSLIRERLTTLIGEFGLTEEEREKRKVENLASSLMQNKTATDDELLAVLNSEILKENNNPDGVVVVRDEEGNPVIKKRVFSI